MGKIVINAGVLEPGVYNGVLNRITVWQTVNSLKVPPQAQMVLRFEYLLEHQDGGHVVSELIGGRLDSQGNWLMSERSNLYKRLGGMFGTGFESRVELVMPKGYETATPDELPTFAEGREEGFKPLEVTVLIDGIEREIPVKVMLSQGPNGYPKVESVISELPKAKPNRR